MLEEVNYWQVAAFWPASLTLGLMGNAVDQKGIQTESGPARFWASSVGGDPAFLLARANALSLQRTKRALRPFGLNARTYTVLRLAAEGTRPSQRELSEFLQLDPSQIVALVDELEASDLARREPDPTDRRAKVVVATDAGAELADRAQAALADLGREWMSEVDESDRVAFSSALAELAREPRR